jgi:glycerophosphoryl diester phosphodiesterase
MSMTVSRFCGIALLVFSLLTPAFAERDADKPDPQFQRAAVIKRLGLRPPKHGGVYVVAHRGAHRGIAENSLPAYERAIEIGVDFVEVDIRVTKDGIPVSMHNPSVDAYVEGAPGRVSDYTLADLRKLDIGAKYGEKWQGTKVPTFAEILDACHGKCGVYLDLKSAPVAVLAEMIKQRHMENDVLWYAGYDRLEEVRRFCSTCIVMPDPGPEQRLEPMLKRMHPSVVASVWRFYSPKFVETCHRAGALVIVDESDPSCWKDATAWGSDGIQTDSPAELIERLKAAN